MMADFCSEMLSEIYIKEKRIATTEETIQITKTAMIKINKLIKRQNKK